MLIDLISSYIGGAVQYY